MTSKLALALLFLTIFTDFLSAQEKASNPIRIGLRAGTYFSSFKFNNLPPEYSKPKGDVTVYGGIQIEIPLSTKFSLDPEILYAFSSVQSFDNAPHQLYQDELSQILIPVLVKYKFGKVSLFAGPQAEILLTAKGAYVVNNQIKNGDIENNSYSKFGFSGVVGAEWVFKYRFGIDARYQFGLTDFRASNGSTLLTNYGTIKANAFQTGIFFRFGKKPNKK